MVRLILCLTFRKLHIIIIAKKKFYVIKLKELIIGKEDFFTKLLSYFNHLLFQIKKYIKEAEKNIDFIDIKLV